MAALVLTPIFCKKPPDREMSRFGNFNMGIIGDRFGKLIKKLVREMDRALSWRWLLVNPDQIVNIYRRKFVIMG